MNNNALTLVNNMALFRKQYHAFVNERVAELEITSSEFSYLKQLVNNDGALQDIIVKNTCVDKAATTRIAQSLEKKDLIKRVKNEKDKRNFNVYLTEKGKPYIKIINEILEDWYTTLGKDVDKDILSAFEETLDKLTHN
ncbi:MarR family winged helix-turn-helix transcriptional regulator [Clostridium massiliamazoniense]|uniref:MarR family winged helix-turn-helix transcriptional regulator n=1 Tax=Clostridium massiliamazoniense TaxID=1347366 RepID=UPI0006D8202F|nr:MarR family transcriptional regulator [Clostridium massiliamazoniense]